MRIGAGEPVREPAEAIRPTFLAGRAEVIERVGRMGPAMIEDQVCVEDRVKVFMIQE